MTIDLEEENMSTRREEARLRKAAEAGDMEAADNLAAMLCDRGDMAGGERWYRVAAERGYLPSAGSLGILLSDRGAFDQAEKWLKIVASTTDPGTEWMVGFTGYVLGKNYLQRGDLDAAELWLTRAAATGSDEATAQLERLRAIRQGGRSGTTASNVLQTFEVSSVTYYDGSGHRLGPSICTVTRTQLIIEGARGGLSQIRLRDIAGISTPGRLVSPKQLRISLPLAAYDIYCQSKRQKDQLEAWLAKAIRET
jgi:hypothetical protein